MCLLQEGSTHCTRIEMSNFVTTSIRGFHYLLTEKSVHIDRSLDVVLLTQRISSSIALVSWWTYIWLWNWTGWVDKTVARGVLDWILVLDWIRAEARLQRQGYMWISFRTWWVDIIVVSGIYILYVIKFEVCGWMLMIVIFQLWTSHLSCDVFLLSSAPNSWAGFALKWKSICCSRHTAVYICTETHL